MRPVHRRLTRLVDAGILRYEAMLIRHAEDRWSECGLAKSIAHSDALGRPHRSVLPLGGITRS